MDRKKLFMNIDINTVTSPFLDSVAALDSPTEEDLYPFVDVYLNSQITHVLLCTFCQYSATDSDVFDSYVDIYHRREEDGYPVDHSRYYQGIYTVNKKFGLDPYEVWFKRCRQVGLKAWMSLRMNDCHCPYDQTSHLRPLFFYEARDNGWMNGEHYEYYKNTYNYAVQQVREKMLAYIKEQLERYDVDGLELDFLREPFCFDYVNDKNCATIMNDFIRNVKAIVTAAEKKHGHKIELSARLMRDIDQNIVLGFDARTWAREGLVDSITVTPRWATCDSDMPLDQWIKELPEVEIYAGLELCVSQIAMKTDVNPLAAQGFVANYLSHGVDGINLYNYFVYPNAPDEQLAWNREIFQTCASLETLKDKPLRHILTYQDIAPEGYACFRPLPLTVTGEEAKTLSIRTSPLSFGKEMKLIIGLKNSDVEDLNLFFEGQLLPQPTGTDGHFYSREPQIEYYSVSLPANDEIYKNIVLSAQNGASVTVAYAEIQIQ